jgi:hypothetical protein
MGFPWVLIGVSMGFPHFFLYIAGIALIHVSLSAQIAELIDSTTDCWGPHT